LGPERQAFEALVEQRRRPRALATNGDRAPEVRAPIAIERPRHNLPRSLTSFVGREQELYELATLLASTPLLTLVGAGGVGKTRLAQELVHARTAAFVDGACFVPLAGLDAPSLLPSAVAAAVGLPDFRGRSATEALGEYLSSKRFVLVLDNCEHLIAACAALVGTLLPICPDLRVLATSREPLAIAGETTWRVLPLELPGPGRKSPEEITRAAAVRLFVERARAANNAFVLTPHNAPAVLRVCVRVDGIPLALELAAARTRLLTVEQIAARLERDLGTLGAAERAVLPQHRTIRATIDWSHALLREQEQILLRRLSVFAGGWTLEAAEEVSPGDGIERSDVLDLLAQLVDKSMVLVDAREAVARYRLLEPVRQYAAERLEAAGEADAYRARHAAALIELACTDEVDDYGPDEVSSLDRVEAEHVNLRAALRWALTHDDNEAALRSAVALFRFWERRGHVWEGCAWIEEALAGAGDAPARLRGRALNALSFLYWRGGDPGRARPAAERALAIHRAVGHTLGVAWALGNLGAIAYYRGEAELALTLLEESVAAAREAGYMPLLSLALTFLGRTVLSVKGATDGRASAVIEEALGVAEAAQSLYATGHALATLGDLGWRRGEVEQALPRWRQALAVRSRLADRLGIAACLERLALVLAASGQHLSAAWLFGAADGQHEVLGIELPHDEQVDHARLIAATAQHLGDAFEPAWLAGRAALVDEAITRAMDETRRLSSDRLVHPA
jgi:non-specific serine/threonine protein kinase